jgi:UDP-glucose-4-epimerase GalE
MKNILVTGGAGYIGSQTCKELHSSGYYPIIFDNLSTGNLWSVKWGVLVRGELIDTDKIIKTIIDKKIEAIIHFAASAYVSESMKYPIKYFENNISSTISLLKAMRETGLKKIVFSSSCAVYGTPIDLPILETFNTNPINPYGESKLITENILKWLGEIENINWIALRYFNASGADPDGEIGECHEPETHIIPLLIKSSLPGNYKIKIYGNDLNTPDGTAIRDYIHVKDLALAHIAALKKLEYETIKKPINLGTGVGISIKELITLIEKVSNLKVRYEIYPKREGDPSTLIASCNKAKELLNWSPKFSNIENIIYDSYNWEKNLKTKLIQRGLQ